MAKKQLSIYVGTHRTRICEVAKINATNIAIYNAIEVVTPDGVVEDGQILDVPALAEAIKGSIYGRGLTTSSISFSIASKKIATKEVTIPFVKPDKVRPIIESNAGDYFPMGNLNDYLFAEAILETLQNEGSKSYRVQAIAAPKDMVEGYYELASALRIPVGTIDFAGNSVFQLLELQMTEEKVCMVLQIEKDNTYISVLKGKSLILQRAVPYGKNEIIKNLSDIRRITERDAEMLLLDEAGLHAAVTDEEFSETVQFMINGINRVMDYYVSRFSSMPVEEIKLFGEGCRIAGVANMLGNELRVNVNSIFDFQGVTFKDGGSLNKHDILKYLACVGSVINPVKLEIKGYYKKKKVIAQGGGEKKAVKVTEKTLILALVVCIAIVVIIVATLGGIYLSLDNERKQLDTKIVSLQEAQIISNLHDAAIKDYETITNFYESTRDPNELIYRFITELEEYIPSEVALQDLSVTNGMVTFNAKGTSKEEVADLIISLSDLAYVENVFVNSLAQTYGEYPEVTFSINLIILKDFEEIVPEEELEEALEVETLEGENSEEGGE